MLLSPSPISLLCALLLCLPLAIVFTITTPSTPLSSSSSAPPPPPPPPPPHPVLAKLTGAGRPTPNLPPMVKRLKTLQKPRNPISFPPPPPPPDPDKVFTKLPSPVVHEISDEENGSIDDGDDQSLFRLAAGVNPNPKPPIKKLAFMFLTTTPLPFAPLWEAFFNKTPKNLYNIYIHADPRFNYTPPFRGVFARRVIPSKPTRRHSSTLTAAARRLLSRALLHDESNYMFVLLSPACIPLHSFNFIYKTLTKSKKSFIEILANEPWAYDRWAARGEEAMYPEVKFEDFRIGSQFFVLKRKHARIVVRDRRLWSKFKLPCLISATCYPEEHYFPTLLSMVDPHGCVAATLTHVDWRGSHGGHPRMYQETEVGPELIWTLRSSRPRYGDEESNSSDASEGRRHDPFLFARKFSPECLLPLMNMANDVIFKD
ncbi:hypothetical protein M9H77_13749 [Catharanthus roseus]|uniref:Uncharacterized protein n=1 Tax=Catharanthus roseus TaxID=4058 RepID=A0ACC0BL30_CATRO|nr:hypothetical protein M9H77_13749 [Catharanthus roseus]